MVMKMEGKPYTTPKGWLIGKWKNLTCQDSIADEMFEGFEAPDLSLDEIAESSYEDLDDLVEFVVRREPLLTEETAGPVKIIFSQHVLDECVREMRRGPLQGVATLVLHPATGRAAVVVEASSGWDYMDPEDGIKLINISDTTGNGGYFRGILGGNLLNLPGHPDIIQVWETDYDAVMLAAKTLVAARPEEEREEIDTLNEIEAVLQQKEVDALVTGCVGCWYTIDDAGGELVELLFDDLREMGYNPEIEETE